MFQIELAAKEGTVECYVRNYRLEFTIPYELYGEPRTYEPDFILDVGEALGRVRPSARWR